MAPEARGPLARIGAFRRIKGVSAGEPMPTTELIQAIQKSTASLVGSFPAIS